MAIRKDADTETLRRTTSPPTALFTLMGWFKISVDRNDYSCFLATWTSASQHFYAGTSTDGVTLISYNPGADGPSGTVLTVGTWYHVALVRAGNDAGNLLVYLNGVLDTAHDAGDAATAALFAGWGILTREISSEWGNGCAAAVKAYNAALTAAEIVQESRQYLPVRTASLNGFYPLFSTGDLGVDYSGAGLALTTAGTLTTEDGPPIPWDVGRHRMLGAGAPPAPEVGYVLVAN